METSSFTFRLERVRSLREGAGEHAREELARELQLRLRGGALLLERFGGVPPYAETQNYVRKVQAFAAEFRTAAPTTTALATFATAAVSPRPPSTGSSDDC